MTTDELVGRMAIEGARPDAILTVLKNHNREIEDPKLKKMLDLWLVYQNLYYLTQICVMSYGFQKGGSDDQDP